MRTFCLLSLVAAWVWCAAIVPAVRADDQVSPQTKAKLDRLHEDLKSKSAKVRAAAYTAIGELGDKAKGEKKRLCEGLLDANPAVQEAAGDALKKVDEAFCKVALGLVINQDGKHIAWAKENAKDAGPLVPVLIAVVNKLSPAATGVGLTTLPEQSEARRKIRAAVDALVTITPDDPEVNKSVIAMLGNPVAELRAEAVSQVPALKDKKAALKGVVGVATNPREMTSTRLAALELLPDLLDDKTTPGVVKQIEAIRFDKDAKVRDEVSELLKKLK